MPTQDLASCNQFQLEGEPVSIEVITLQHKVTQFVGSLVAAMSKLQNVPTVSCLAIERINDSFFSLGGCLQLGVLHKEAPCDRSQYLDSKIMVGSFYLNHHHNVATV